MTNTHPIIDVMRAFTRSSLRPGLHRPQGEAPYKREFAEDSHGQGLGWIGI